MEEKRARPRPDRQEVEDHVCRTLYNMYGAVTESTAAISNRAVTPVTLAVVYHPPMEILVLLQ